MTDFTEQWKRGELPDRLYYVKYPDRVEINTKGHLEIYLEYAKNDYKNKMEVLAVVPTYEEWQNLRAKLDFKETEYDFDTDRLEKDCKVILQKLLSIKPELKKWAELNFKEYI